MDFIEKLQDLAAKVPKLCPLLQTEEATKNALVMPFINALGYDIFNPLEVIPEFTADVGIKKGEKVDYAIKKNNKVIMLFECKHCGSDLNVKHASQLFRYFAVTEARIGVLTNGVVYQFFTDLEAPNKMDDRPFLELNLLDIGEGTVAELKKLTQPHFDVDEMMTTAGELKYTRQIKRLLAEQLESPTDEFVKFFASQVYSGVLTQSRREYFADITRRAFSQFIKDRLNQRLASAMEGVAADAIELDTATKEVSEVAHGATKSTIKPDDGIETTEQELEGYYIIKALLRDQVDPSRIVHRDTKSYMGILLDDNNRKPLARLYFNAQSQKYIGVFDEERNEERMPINDLNELYQHAEKIRRVLALYTKTETQELNK